jgi:hypothetical protein
VEEPGWIRILNDRVKRMLEDAASQLSCGDRFRLWLAEVKAEAIAAHIFLAAGGEVSYWLGGFAEAWAKQHPSMQTILAAIEHAWSAGEVAWTLAGEGVLTNRGSQTRRKPWPG